MFSNFIKFIISVESSTFKSKVNKNKNIQSTYITDDVDYVENDIMVERSKKTLNKPNRKAFSISDQSDNMIDNLDDSSTSVINSHLLNRFLPVRIWGYLDIGAFPLEQLLQTSQPFPSIGFEDFFLWMNGTLEHRKVNSDWLTRRTQFSFDCFVYLPDFGTLAVALAKHRTTIMHYQLSKPRSSSWHEPFDVPLKVFYSEKKFDSCVHLNSMVALMAEDNRLTIVDTGDLAKSFHGPISEVITSVEVGFLFEVCSIN